MTDLQNNSFYFFGQHKKKEVTDIENISRQVWPHHRSEIFLKSRSWRGSMSPAEFYFFGPD